MFEGTTLGPLDVAVFSLALAVSVLIGLYFANQNRTFKDYTTGGGNQSFWPVSASMAAGYSSSLTVIGNPSEFYLHGAGFSVSMIATLVSWPISSFIFLPVFRRLNGVSVFQYIEKRYSPFLRRIVSLVFILQMTLYSAMTLYVPSLSLNAILGVPNSVSIGLVGSVCLVYSTFGGIKAVIWTNLFHAMLMCLAMAAITIGGVLENGGFARVWNTASEGGRLSLHSYFNLDLTTRHTIYNMLLGFTISRIFLHGTSQMQVQSALSLSTLRRGQMSQLIAAIMFLILQTIASSVGLVLYAKYKDCDPFASGQIHRRDAIVMHYLTNHLGFIPAMQGIFIAGVFSSTLTAMSSFQSSMSAMIVEDFVRPGFKRCKRILSDEQGAVLGKLTAFLFGLACIGLTFLVEKIDGLLQVTSTLFGALGTPILATFALGLLTRFINTKGMFAGMSASLASGIYVQIYQTFYVPPLEPTLRISTAACSHRSPIEPANYTLNYVKRQRIPTDFNLAQVSYFWLPLILMLIATLVATIVSLLTGGLKQHVDEKYLAPIFYKYDDSSGIKAKKCVT